jgi:hypothetical protein
MSEMGHLRPSFTIAADGSLSLDSRRLKLIPVTAAWVRQRRIRRVRGDGSFSRKQPFRSASSALRSLRLLELQYEVIERTRRLLG